MEPLTPPFSPSDRLALRARLTIDRPLHWTLARGLLAALEEAWDRVARLERLAAAEPRATQPDQGTGSSESRPKVTPSAPNRSPESMNGPA